MVFKKLIDEHTIEDVPRNGIIAIEATDKLGNVTINKTAVSNLIEFIEDNPDTANKNGYYEYTEDSIPECNENEHLLFRYELEGNTIIKRWIKTEAIDE